MATVDPLEDGVPGHPVARTGRTVADQLADLKGADGTDGTDGTGGLRGDLESLGRCCHSGAFWGIRQGWLHALSVHKWQSSHLCGFVFKIPSSWLTD